MDYESDSIFPTDATGRDAEVRNMFRQGKVIDILVDDTQVSVRVQFLDKQQLISKFIPVKQFGSRSTSNFWCPKIGDDVSVTILPNSDGSDGFVDGSFYNTGNPPPIIDPNTRHITFADGTVIEYAEKSTKGVLLNARAGKDTKGTGTLTINSVGPINIVCTGTCSIESGGVATVKAPQIILDTPKVIITGDLIVEGTVNFAAGKGGTTMTISGDINHSGNISTSGRHTDANGVHHP